MLHRSVPYRFILLLLLLVLAATLVPLLLLAPYDIPCADDFNYSIDTHRAFLHSGRPTAVLGAAMKTAANVYKTWQGTYAAAFLMALQPAICGERMYAVTPFLMLGILILGTFCLCMCLFSRIFRLPRQFGACVAAVLCLLSIGLQPSPVQAFFWYNSSIFYTFFYSLSLLAFALAIPVAQKGGVARIVVLSALCLFLGGGNYVTALNSSLLFAAATFLCLVTHKSGWKHLLVPLLFLLFGFGLSIAAPGNAVRQNAIGPATGALRAIGGSFGRALQNSVHFFSLPVFGSLVLLAVLFWPAATQTAFPFRLPGLVTLFSFCLFSALFTPTLYALGSSGDARVRNIVYDAYLLLLVLNEFYWIGWLQQRRGGISSAVHVVPLLCAASLCLSCCLGYVLSGNPISTLGALGHLRSGDAALYRRAADERFTVLQDASILDAVLEPFPVKPYLLFFDDITVDENDSRNQSICIYYDKDSVVLNMSSVLDPPPAE